MTRTLFIAAAAALALLVLSFVGGLAGGSAGFLVLGLLCAGPGFFLALGAALGRASNEFTVVRKDRRGTAPQARVINSRIQPTVREELG